MSKLPTIGSRFKVIGTLYVDICNTGRISPGAKTRILPVGSILKTVCEPRPSGGLTLGPGDAETQEAYDAVGSDHFACSKEFALFPGESLKDKVRALVEQVPSQGLIAHIEDLIK